MIFLFILMSCSSVTHNTRALSSPASNYDCRTALDLIAHHSRSAKNEAKRLINKFQSLGGPSHIDSGGGGRYSDAININPYPLTATTGEAGNKIPHWIFGRGDSLPLPSNSIHKITVENAPINQEAIREMLRVLRPRGEINLFHPEDYAEDVHLEVIRAFVNSVQSTRVTSPKIETRRTVITISN